MTIKELEQQLGIGRSFIRFYEKEQIVVPKRNEKNGYREYSEEDLKQLRKVIFLRNLGITIEEIKKLQTGKISLENVLKCQMDKLSADVSQGTQAIAMCNALLDKNIHNYQDWNGDALKSDKQVAGHDLQPASTISSDKHLFYSFGSDIIWANLVIISFFAALIFHSILPEKIPIQWRGTQIASSADKLVIFAYPVVGLLMKCIYPVIWAKLNSIFRLTYRAVDHLTSVIVNGVTAVALTIEVFTVIYLKWIPLPISALIIVDVIILGLWFVIVLIKYSGFAEAK